MPYYNQQQLKTDTQEHFMHRGKNAFFYSATVHSLALSIFFASMFTRRFCNKFRTAADKKSGQRRVPQVHVSHFSCATNIDSPRALRGPIGHENTSTPHPAISPFCPAITIITHAPNYALRLREKARSLHVFEHQLCGTQFNAKRYEAPKFEVRVRLNCRELLQSLKLDAIIYPCLVIMFGK
jgi:hypothetical protein